MAQTSLGDSGVLWQNNLEMGTFCNKSIIVLKMNIDNISMLCPTIL